jgi:hypothetical protein
MTLAKAAFQTLIHAMRDHVQEQINPREMAQNYMEESMHSMVMQVETDPTISGPADIDLITKEYCDIFLDYFTQNNNFARVTYRDVFKLLTHVGNPLDNEYDNTRNPVAAVDSFEFDMLLMMAYDSKVVVPPMPAIPPPVEGQPPVPVVASIGPYAPAMGRDYKGDIYKHVHDVFTNAQTQCLITGAYWLNDSSVKLVDVAAYEQMYIRSIEKPITQAVLTGMGISLSELASIPRPSVATLINRPAVDWGGITPSQVMCGPISDTYPPTPSELVLYVNVPRIKASGVRTIDFGDCRNPTFDYPMTTCDIDAPDDSPNRWISSELDPATCRRRIVSTETGLKMVAFIEALKAYELNRLPTYDFSRLGGLMIRTLAKHYSIYTSHAEGRMVPAARYNKDGIIGPVIPFIASAYSNGIGSDTGSFANYIMFGNGLIPMDYWPDSVAAAGFNYGAALFANGNAQNGPYSSGVAPGSINSPIAKFIREECRKAYQIGLEAMGFPCTVAWRNNRYWFAGIPNYGVFPGHIPSKYQDAHMGVNYLWGWVIGQMEEAGFAYMGAKGANGEAGYPVVETVNDRETGSEYFRIADPEPLDPKKGLLGFPNEITLVKSSIYVTPPEAPTRNIEFDDDAAAALNDIVKTLNTAQIGMMQRFQSYHNHLLGTGTNWVRAVVAGNMKERVITPTMVILENVDEAAFFAITKAFRAVLEIAGGAIGGAIGGAVGSGVGPIGTGAGSVAGSVAGEQFVSKMIDVVMNTKLGTTVSGMFDEEALDYMMSHQSAFLENAWKHHAPESWKLSETNSNDPIWEARFANETKRFKIKNTERNVRTFYTDGTVIYYDAASGTTSRGYNDDFDIKVAEVFNLPNPVMYEGFQNLSPSQQEAYAAYTNRAPSIVATVTPNTRNTGSALYNNPKFPAPIRDEFGVLILPSKPYTIGTDGQVTTDLVRLGMDDFAAKLFSSNVQFESVPFAYAQMYENYNKTKIEIMIDQDGNGTITEAFPTNIQSMTIVPADGSSTTTTFSQAPAPPG